MNILFRVYIKKSRYEGDGKFVALLRLAFPPTVGGRLKLYEQPFALRDPISVKVESVTPIADAGQNQDPFRDVSEGSASDNSIHGEIRAYIAETPDDPRINTHSEFLKRNGWKCEEPSDLVVQ
ncbi:MAG TPA: hypothetical protein VIR98_00725 [Candidatus Paceibacterota bacterium]